MFRGTDPESFGRPLIPPALHLRTEMVIGTDGSRRATLIVGLLLLTVPLAGCLGYGGEAGSYSATWEQEPADAQAGETIQMSWKIDGPEEGAETRAFYGQESAGEPKTEADYEESAGRVAPADVPGTYDADVTLNQPGTYYFSARLLVEEGGQAVWTEEIEVEVTSGQGTDTPVVVEMGDTPSDATTNQPIEVSWSLSGIQGEIDQTAFYWGSSSVQDPSTEDYDNQAGLTKPADVPDDYNASFQVEEPGTIYGRARAFDDGSASWSDEIEIEIQSGNEAGNLVEIHDEGTAGVTTSTEFRPDTITVTASQNVTWTNQGDGTHSIDFADESLDDSEPIEPGETFTWEIPEDLEPGEYEYEDGETTTSAQGSVQVEAPE